MGQESGKSLLIGAVRRGNVAHAVWYLDEYNFSPDVKDGAGMPIILTAVKKNDLPMVDMLIERGATLVPARTLYSPLYTALLNDVDDMVNVLIGKGMDINAPHGPTGETILMGLVSASSVTPRIIEKAVRLGADVHVQTKSGYDAFSMALLNPWPEQKEVAALSLADMGVDLRFDFHATLLEGLAAKGANRANLLIDAAYECLRQCSEMRESKIANEAMEKVARQRAQVRENLAGMNIMRPRIGRP